MEAGERHRPGSRGDPPGRAHRGGNPVPPGRGPRRTRPDSAAASRPGYRQADADEAAAWAKVRPAGRDGTSHAELEDRPVDLGGRAHRDPPPGDFPGGDRGANRVPNGLKPTRKAQAGMTHPRKHPRGHAGGSPYAAHQRAASRSPSRTGAGCPGGTEVCGPTNGKSPSNTPTWSLRKTATPGPRKTATPGPALLPRPLEIRTPEMEAEAQ